MSSSNSSVEGSNVSKRCAACIHAKRRCDDDCFLAPYFPATNIERYECVHKIFGHANVAKMLKMVPVDKRAEAANSLSTEAYLRVKDPVYGITRVLGRLHQELSAARCELARTLDQISMYKAHNASEQQPPLPPPLMQQQGSLGTQDQHMFIFDPNDQQGSLNTQDQNLFVFYPNDQQGSLGTQDQNMFVFYPNDQQGSLSTQDPNDEQGSLGTQDQNMFVFYPNDQQGSLSTQDQNMLVFYPSDQQGSLRTQDPNDEQDSLSTQDQNMFVFDPNDPFNFS